MERREWDSDRIERIAADVVDAGVWLHRKTGPGMRERVYESLLAKKLRRGGHRIERQKRARFYIDQELFSDGLRPDLIVDELVIVELKSSKFLHPRDSQQVLTYLRALDLPLGLLLNFGGPTLKKGGIRRVLNNYYPNKY